MSVDSARARFMRPPLDSTGLGAESCAPSVRIGFRTDSRTIRIKFSENGLYRRQDVNRVGDVFIDGSERLEEFGDTGVDLVFDSIQDRAIEIVMPYGASLDFNGITLDGGSSSSAPRAKPARPRYVAYGDSITQGYRCSDVSKSWAELLARRRDFELVNMGYAGKTCDAGDALAVCAQHPDIVTIMIGWNDCAGSVGVGSFAANYRSLLQVLRSERPDASIFAITPLWTSGLPDIEAYRDAIAGIVAEFSRNVVLVEGPDLASGTAECFPDGVHPSDLAASEIADRLSRLIP